MTRSRGRLHSLALGAAIPLWAAWAAMEEAAFNPLHALSGRWEAHGPGVNGTAGDCRGNSDEYRISEDGRHVELLLRRGDKTERERFVVMHVENDRVLLFVEGEPGRNEFGGPIVWWAVFDGHNRFRWRRDDWPRNNLSALEWRRCW